MEDERSGLDFAAAAAAGGAAGMAGFGQAAAGANQMDTPKESGIYPRISMATTTGTVYFHVRSISISHPFPL